MVNKKKNKFAGLWHLKPWGKTLRKKKKVESFKRGRRGKRG